MHVHKADLSSVRRHVHLRAGGPPRVPWFFVGEEMETLEKL